MVIGIYCVGVTGSIVALAVTALISLFINGHVIYCNLKIHSIQYDFHGMMSELSQLWKTNTILFLLCFVNAVALWCPNFILSQTENVFSPLGIYWAMMQFYTVICFLPNQLTQIVLPLASTALAENNNQKYKKLILSFSIFVLFVGLLIAVPTALLSKYLVPLFGPGYEEGTNILPYVAFTAVLAALSTMYSRFIIAIGKISILLLMTLLWGTIFISMSYYLITNNHGAFGTAISLLTAWGVQAVLVTSYIFFRQTNPILNTLINYRSFIMNSEQYQNNNQLQDDHTDSWWMTLIGFMLGFGILVMLAPLVSWVIDCIYPGFIVKHKLIGDRILIILSGAVFLFFVYAILNIFHKKGFSIFCGISVPIIILLIMLFLRFATDSYVFRNDNSDRPYARYTWLITLVSIYIPLLFFSIPLSATAKKYAFIGTFISFAVASLYAIIVVFPSLINGETIRMGTFHLKCPYFYDGSLWFDAYFAVCSLWLFLKQNQLRY